MSHVFLVGFMGSGKSTVGEVLAKKMGRPFLDLDEIVRSHDGRSIPDIFAQEGEAGFRRLEREALTSLADVPDSVVACGGGVVTDEGSRRELARQGRVVHLDVTAAEAVARVGDASGRPLLGGSDPLSKAEELVTARDALYRSVAEASIETVGRTPGEIAEDVARVLATRAASKARP